MAMVIVEVRPGVRVRMREEDAERENLTVIQPGAHRKAAPAAVKRAPNKTKSKPKRTPVEDTDAVRNDD